MSFETAFALYILNKGLLEKAKEEVETSKATSKAIFDAAPPRNLKYENMFEPAKPERDYLAALSHFRDMEAATRYTKTKAAIAKVAETKDCRRIEEYETYVNIAKKSELEYTKAKYVADRAETEAVRIENEAETEAKRAANNKALADTYAKADADAEAAMNAADDSALDAAAAVASSKAAKAKATASATAGFAVRAAAAAVKAKDAVVKAKAAADRAKANADDDARRVVEIAELLEAVKVVEANM